MNISRSFLVSVLVLAGLVVGVRYFGSLEKPEFPARIVAVVEEEQILKALRWYNENATSSLLPPWPGFTAETYRVSDVLWFEEKEDVGENGDSVLEVEFTWVGKDQVLEHRVTFYPSAYGYYLPLYPENKN